MRRGARPESLLEGRPWPPTGIHLSGFARSAVTLRPVGEALMDALPSGTATLLVRTEFQDDEVWQEVVAAATGAGESPPDAVALLPVDDPQFVGCTNEQLLSAAAENHRAGSTVLFVADTQTMELPDMPVLVLNMESLPGGRTWFRCVPAELSMVENDLSIGQLDWEDFAESAAENGGVYQGAWPT